MNEVFEGSKDLPVILVLLGLVVLSVLWGLSVPLVLLGRKVKRDLRGILGLREILEKRVKLARRVPLVLLVKVEAGEAELLFLVLKDLLGQKVIPDKKVIPENRVRLVKEDLRAFRD